MKIEYSNGVMSVSKIVFDPRLTLMDSAQVFHWTEQDGVFRGTCGGHSACVQQTEDGFCVYGVRADEIEFWSNYFDLERDYEAVIDACAAYPMAQQAMRLLPGLRVLRQSPWETLLTFIISENNNVSRIRTIVHKLIKEFGTDGAFPTPAQLSEADEEALRGIGCGYRAPYLKGSACMVRDGFDPEALSEMAYEAAHEKLLTLPGVGDKVAACVQLFGMGHSEAFPVDVWVERLMRQWFFGGQKLGKKALRIRAQEMFGKNAGIIQQSLFHCARLGLIELEK